MFLPILVLALQAAQEAQPLALQERRFHDVSAERGVQPTTPSYGQGTGLAAADYDDDGDVDLFVPTGAADRLYANQGRGFFTDVASAVGLDDPQANRAALWFDHDGDHDLDLVVANDSPLASSSLRLYEHPATLPFVDRTATAGLLFDDVQDAATHRGGLCAGDIDRDGFLDLYVAVWYGEPHLFHNQGDGTFADITQSSGVSVLEFQWQPMMFDADRDGWQDLYVAVDFTENRLWINQTDLTFVDRAAEAGADMLMNDMGMSIVDHDGDGDLDVFTTNVYDLTGGEEHNVLLENRSVGSTLAFVDVSTELGVGRGGWGWGITALDVDLDTDADIAATNGYFSLAGIDASRFFLNLGPGRGYRAVGQGIGFRDLYWGSALVAADWDRDGDPDLVQACMEGPVRFLENRRTRTRLGRSAHSLTVVPRMGGANRWAIGAEVRVTVGGRTSARLISAGTSFLGQEPAEACFGLGAHTQAECVTVLFPDGSQRVLENVPASTYLVVE